MVDSSHKANMRMLMLMPMAKTLSIPMLMPMPCARANKMEERSIIAEINKVREIVSFKNKWGLRL